MGGDRRVRCQWSEIVVDQFAAGGITVGIGHRPAGRFEQLACAVVDDVAPRREERDMAPLGDSRARPGSSLEHDEGLVAQRELRRGGEADWAGADDRHGKGFQGGCGRAHVDAPCRCVTIDRASGADLLP